LLEFHTNCIELYGTTIKIFILGQSGTELYHTGWKPVFSTVITNEFVGEGFYLSQHSMDGYEAMRFDVTQVTQDVEQSLFIIKTNVPIPVLVYGDAFK
jgi:hypothetical protein